MCSVFPGVIIYKKVFVNRIYDKNDLNWFVFCLIGSSMYRNNTKIAFSTVVWVLVLNSGVEKAPCVLCVVCYYHIRKATKNTGKIGGVVNKRIIFEILYIYIYQSIYAQLVTAGLSSREECIAVNKKWCHFWGDPVK